MVYKIIRRSECTVKSGNTIIFQYLGVGRKIIRLGANDHEPRLLAKALAIAYASNIGTKCLEKKEY